MHVQPRHSNRKPYEHVSDTPTSVRAEVQHENYCTFLHIWMMLRSIELFPEDGSPVGRTPFILSVLTLRSSHPLGGFPPRPPPSFSRLLLARRKYFHDKSRYTRVFMPRWRRPRRRWGFPRLRHRFFSAPHTRSLPPLSLLYHEVEWNWSNVPVFLLFCTLGFLLSVWWGLREFVWGVCVCVCACALCDFWPWWEFCEGLVALQCMRYTYFFDKKEFLPSGLNWFFFFFFGNFELENWS